jgi:hypothetical protein
MISSSGSMFEIIGSTISSSGPMSSCSRSM